MDMSRVDLNKHTNPDFLKQEITSIKRRLEELSMRGNLSEEEKQEFSELESKWKNYEDDLHHLGQ